MRELVKLILNMIQSNKKSDSVKYINFIKNYVFVNKLDKFNMNIDTKSLYYKVNISYIDKKTKNNQLIFLELIIDKDNYKILHYFSNNIEKYFEYEINKNEENEKFYNCESVIKIFNYKNKWIILPEYKKINNIEYLYGMFNKKNYYTYFVNNNKLKFIGKGKNIQKFNETIKNKYLDKNHSVKLPKTFYIKIAENNNDCKDWVSKNNEKILGIDLKWKTDTKDVNNKPSYIQLSTSNSCIIYKINEVLPETIINILADKSIYKYGIGIFNILKKLNMITNIKVENLMDIGEMAKSIGINAPGTGINGNLHGRNSLCNSLFNKKYPKSKKNMSYWSITNLSQLQKEYAALDAWICAQISNKLSTLK